MCLSFTLTHDQFLQVYLRPVQCRNRYGLRDLGLEQPSDRGSNDADFSRVHDPSVQVNTISGKIM